MINRVSGVSWDSSDNISIDTFAQFKTLKEEDNEGIIIVGGHNDVGDGGGGVFIYVPTTLRTLHNNGTIIAPSDDYLGEGCYHRIFSNNIGSLAWFGVSNPTTNDLLSIYGIEGMVVDIVDGSKGGKFKFYNSEVVNSDNLNNFDGWVRINDANFTHNINMNGNRVEGAGRALGNNDLTTLEQVSELIKTGDYVGIVPLYEPRHTGDGVTTIYSTPADSNADPVLLAAAAFEVTIDGLKLRPLTDYTINLTNGNCEFVVPPTNGSKIDIVWFAPIIVSEMGDIVVTASVSGKTHLLSDWLGKDSKDITVQGTGTSGYKSLGDRFADNAVYFSHKTDLLNNYTLLKPGAVAITKGATIAGDGGLGTYFIKTQAQADIDGDDYTSPDTLSFLIPTPSWVAVYQRVNPQVQMGETATLAAGQTVVTFQGKVGGGQCFISGDSVDRGKLKLGEDYTVALNGKTITLLESFPEGSKLTFNWYEPFDNSKKIEEIVAGTNVTIDNTDPARPIISSNVDISGKLDSVVAGSNVSIDATDPNNPIISSTSHFRGTFVDLVALQSGVSNPVAGDFADVDGGVGEDVKRYIYDASDVVWVQQGSGAGGLDPLVGEIILAIWSFQNGANFGQTKLGQTYMGLPLDYYVDTPYGIRGSGSNGSASLFGELLNTSLIPANSSVQSDLGIADLQNGVFCQAGFIVSKDSLGFRTYSWRIISGARRPVSSVYKEDGSIDYIRLDMQTKDMVGGNPDEYVATAKFVNDLIATCPTYADEAAAVTAGLDSGKPYKTPTGELRVKL